MLKPLILRLQRDAFVGRGSRGLAPMLGRTPLPVTQLRISGVTKDSAGVPLGFCRVELYRTSDDVVLDRTLSDANGNYEFRSASSGDNRHYVVAYLAGTPDRAGTTVNTLIAS